MWAFQGPDDQAHVFYTIWSWALKLKNNVWHEFVAHIIIIEYLIDYYNRAKYLT